MANSKYNTSMALLIILGTLLGSFTAWANPGFCHGVLTEMTPKPLSKADLKRLSQAKTAYYRISPGEVITLQTIKPASVKKPTLLLLPGIFRALTALSIQEEPRAQQLVQQGFGVALLNLSTQPYSIMALDAGETPAYKEHIQDYVSEAEAAIQILQTQYGVQNVIPVSLSFSSVISVSLNGFPTIIDTAPLTSTAADKPDLNQAMQKLNIVASLNAFNPFFDKNYVRNNLDKAYQTKWASYVDEDPTGHIRRHEPSDLQRQQITESYIGMTRAVENFKWPEITTATTASTRRIFILARNESPSLLKDQLQVFHQLFKSNPRTVLFLIEESGHVIPKEQPAAYSAAIAMGLSPALQDFGGIIVLKPSTGEMTQYTGADIEKYLQSLERSLKN